MESPTNAPVPAPAPAPAPAEVPDRPAFPPWRRMAVVAALYAGAAVLGTFPAITTARTALPGQFADPLVHLWTLRWHKQCLMEGRLPFHAPGIQHPIGAPVGYLPPLQYQSVLYLGLSAAIPNDVLCFNVIWFLGFVVTGCGAYVLAWYVLRDGWAAALAGLLAMLGGPMTYFAGGQVEQITLGWFPLFLVGWIRFVDRPSTGRLAGAAALYLLLASSAPYYGLFGVFPATLYVLWKSWGGGRRRRSAFILPRLGWFAAFVGLTLPALAVLFSSQIWAMTHGFPMDRSSGEFQLYKATLGSYLVPQAPKPLAVALEARGRAALGGAQFPAYLGAVTVALLAYAAAARARFDRASFWWLALASMLLLSLGASATIGGAEIPLPAHWLRDHAKILKPIRVPGRFAFFAGVLAALIAAAGLKHLLARVPGAVGRGVLGTLVLGVALLDLSHVPFGTTPLPPMPECYRVIGRLKPDAALFEAPHLNGAWRMPALCTYWQSLHGLRTSAGYTADFNPVHENLITQHSPFHAYRLADPSYLDDPEAIPFDPVGLVAPQPFDDFTWLYLRAFGFDYVVLHHRPGDYPELPVRLGPVKERLAPARVFEDEATAVYDTALLPPPERPVLLCADGWRGYIHTRAGVGRIVDPVSRLFLYNPTPDRPVVLALRAMTRRPSRAVELWDGDALLARWEIGAGAPKTLISPPLPLPEGLSRLTLRCDGVEPDASRMPQFEKERAPYGLWVSGLGLDSTPELAASWDRPAAAVADRPTGIESR